MNNDLFRSVSLGVLLVCASTSVVADESRAAQLAKIPELSSLPPQVPAEYLATPSGFFHKSCVQDVPNGGMVLADGIYDKNGVLLRKNEPCRYPSFVHLPGGPERVIQPENPADDLVPAPVGR